MKINHRSWQLIKKTVGFEFQIVDIRTPRRYEWRKPWQRLSLHFTPCWATNDTVKIHGDKTLRREMLWLFIVLKLQSTVFSRRSTDNSRRTKIHQTFIRTYHVVQQTPPHVSFSDQFNSFSFFFVLVFHQPTVFRSCRVRFLVDQRGLIIPETILWRNVVIIYMSDNTEATFCRSTPMVALAE